MASNVEIQMDGLKKRINTIRKRAKNANPITQKVSILMYKDINDHFKKESGPRSGWKPLKYRTGRALQDTGDLRKSVQASNTKDSATVSAGNDEVDYAAAQNFGANITNGFGKGISFKVPARKFLWISKDTKTNIKKILGRFFIGN